jgi:LPXTG-site transpeptidase (sortase) family protein
VGSLFRRLISSPPTILGALLVVAGVVFLGYSIGAYFEAVPGSRVTVPRPAALDQPRPTATPMSATPTPVRAPVAAAATPTVAVPRPAPTGEPQAVAPRPTLRPINGAMLAPPDPSIYLVPMPSADAEDRPFWGNRPHPGLARHLEIPAIEVDTEVIEGGIIMNQQGEPEWETVPFVALHYRDTAPVGGRGNAVISGHVVTISMGNVFRDLYKLNFGDTVTVETAEGRFTYVVDDLKLVTPSSVEVMAPTTSPTLTLITCGGEFDSRSRSFSDRLIVTSRLVDWERLPAS